MAKKAHFFYSHRLYWEERFNSIYFHEQNLYLDVADVFGEVFCIGRGLAAETSSNATVLTITAFTVGNRGLHILHIYLYCVCVQNILTY